MFLLEVDDRLMAYVDGRCFSPRASQFQTCQMEDELDEPSTGVHLRWKMEVTKEVNMGVSKNRGTPKWMVYNENPY